jgi:hypothetical protein
VVPRRLPTAQVISYVITVFLNTANVLYVTR